MKTVFVSCFVWCFSAFSFSQSAAKVYHDEIQDMVDLYERYENAMYNKLVNYSSDSLQETYDLWYSNAQSSLETVKNMEPWTSDAAFRDIAIEYFSVGVSFGKDEFKQAVALILAGEGHKPKKDELSKEELTNEVLPSYEKKYTAKYNLYLNASAAFLKKYDPDFVQPEWLPGCGEVNNMMNEFDDNFGHYKVANPTISGDTKTHTVAAPPIKSEKAEIIEKTGSNEFQYVLFTSPTASDVTARYDAFKKVLDQCLSVGWKRSETSDAGLYHYQLTDQDTVVKAGYTGQNVILKEVSEGENYKLVLVFSNIES